jgi:excisionase family DNA binding protein
MLGSFDMQFDAINADLLKTLREGFGGCPTVSFKEACRLMKLDEKTLRKHVRLGHIEFRAVGLGHVRVRREFALEDILGFYMDARRRVETRESTVRVRAPLPYSILGFTQSADRPEKPSSRRHSAKIR